MKNVIKFTAMKTILLLILSLAISSTGAHAQPLTWQDLVQKPELRPEYCTIKERVDFEGGGGVKAGDKVIVRDVNVNDLVVETLNGSTRFFTQPSNTDVLEAANTAYAALTPAQRALTYEDISRRQELWPYRIHTKEPFQLNGRTFHEGDVFYLSDITDGRAIVTTAEFDTRTTLDIKNTDILKQAREYVETPGGSPGLVAEELQDKLVNPITGTPATLPLTDITYFLVYNGAGWCPFCRNFTPNLVKFYTEKKLTHAEMEVIYVPSDKSEADMKRFAQEMNFPWPAVRFEDRKKLAVLAKVFRRGTIPAVAVLDRYGNIIIDNSTIDTDALLREFAERLK